MSLVSIATVVLCGIAATCAAQRGRSDAPLLEVRDWRKARPDAWTFADLAAAEHKGRISTLEGVLHLEDNSDGTSAGPEARWSAPVRVPNRFALEFRARLLHTGLADESAGDSALHLKLGAQAPDGAFGFDVGICGDRFNVDQFYKVWRTDANWHLWRLEADTKRRTIAMFRDGEYVCLHSTGSAQPAGLSIQVKGTTQTPSSVEIDHLTIAPLDEPSRPAPAKSKPKADLAPGEWPIWRRDVRNTAVSPLAGKIQQPRIAWSIDVGGEAATHEFLDLDGDGQSEALVSRGGTLSALRLDGSELWKRRLDNAVIYGLFDLAGDGEKALVVAAGTPSQFHALRPSDGSVQYVCPQFPTSGVAGIRVAKIDPEKRGLQAVVWSHFHEIGYCLSFTDGIERGKVDWTFDWKQSFFTPLTALADMDRDGVLDLVVATYNHAFVFDGRTGAEKMLLEYHSGRNYGTLVVKDIDGDGYPDIVVLADVLREHVDVIKNERGKSLRLLWTKFYEQNYPDDHVSMRVLTESVDDFDGDGKTEIVYGVFDDRTDSHWHTLVVDAVTGAVKADMLDRYPVGAGALFPGKPPGLILSTPKDRMALKLNQLTISSFTSGGWREQKLSEGTLLSRTAVRDFAVNTWGQVSGIATGTPTTALTTLDLGSKHAGFYLVRPDKRIEFVTGDASGDVVSAWQASMPRALATSAIQEVQPISPDAKGPQRVCSGSDGVCHIISAAGDTIAKLGSRGGVIVLPVVGRLKSGEAPSLLFIDPKGALQCFRADKPGEAPKRAWSRQAQGCWSYYMPHSRPNGVPVIADVTAMGEKSVLVARKPDRLVAFRSDGSIARSWKFPALPQQWVGSPGTELEFAL